MRAIPTLKISISGVRGVVGDSLTPALLTRFAQAFGTYAGSGTVVLGRDTRTSGEMVRQAVVAGLLSSGCRVVDAGVCPVPTVQLAVRHRRAQGGIAITASHNPAEWNALKFIGPDGLFLGAGPARELLDIYHQGDYVKVAGTEMRSVERMADALDLHFKAILDAVGPLPARPAAPARGARRLQRRRRLPRAPAARGPWRGRGPDQRDAERPLPAAGGTAAGEPRRALRGRPHASAATSASRRTWTRTGSPSCPSAANRSARTSRWCSPPWYVLGKTPGPVVANLSTTAALDEVARRFNCPVVRTKIGEANVTERMQSERAVIGGEGNGGVIYPSINFARDSQVGMALILHLLASSGKTVSGLVADLPRFVMVKEKLTCPSNRIPDVLRMVKREFAHLPMDTRDGVKVMLPDGLVPRPRLEHRAHRPRRGRGAVRGRSARCGEGRVRPRRQDRQRLKGHLLPRPRVLSPR